MAPASHSTIILRPWQDADLAPYARMNADHDVMAFYPKCLSQEESEASYRRLRQGIEERGWGLWVVEVDGEFAGYTGLSVPTFTAHFTPCVEIGWRLRRKFWGRSIGYAAAVQAEHFAFGTLKLPELVSFTAAINQRSRRLMERLEYVHRSEEDFLHPSLDEDSLLRPHVLYRKRNPILARK